MEIFLLECSNGIYYSFEISVHHTNAEFFIKNDLTIIINESYFVNLSSTIDNNYATFMDKQSMSE